MLLRNDGWRQAMVGSITLYDEDGERLHTSYLAQSPEYLYCVQSTRYGKERFLREFEKEIAATKQLYQGKIYVGLADGAADTCTTYEVRSNWKFLEKHTEIEVLDFYHAAECLAKVSKAAFTAYFVHLCCNEVQVQYK